MDSVQSGNKLYPEYTKESVLGPVLFILYVDDMPNHIESFCKIFADDIKLYSTVGSQNDQDILQSDLLLLKLCEWSENWLLDFSVPKCKPIQYGNVTHEYTYHMKDKNGNLQPLPDGTEEKDLGIIFQKTLKFVKHINNTVNRANRLIGMIKRTFRTLNRDLFLTLYKSLIRSILDYCGCVWSPSSKKNIQLLENVQRRATRIVPDIIWTKLYTETQSSESPDTITGAVDMI